MRPTLSLFGRDRKKDSDNKKSGTNRKIDIQRTGLAIITIAVLSYLLSVHLLPSRLSLRPGDISPEDIRAQRTVRYFDKEETERRKAQAAEDVGKIYDPVPTSRHADIELKEVFLRVEELRKDTVHRDYDVKANLIRRELGTQFGSEISHAALITLVSVPDSDFIQIKDFSEKLVGKALEGEIRDDTDDLENAHAAAAQKAEMFFGNSATAIAVAEIAKSAIKPNRIYNDDSTKRERREAVAQVQSVHSEIVTGELIVGKGERITQSHIDRLTALGLIQPKLEIRTSVALSMFVSFLVLLVTVYLARYQPKVYASTRQLAMLALVVILATLGLKVGGTMLGLKLTLAQLGYVGVMAVTTCGMLLAVLVNPQVAVMLVSLLAITSGIVMNFELRYAATSLVAGLVAIYSVAYIRTRSDMKRSFAALAITNVAMVWIMGGMTGETASFMATASLWAVAMAFSSTMLFLFGTELLEKPFGIITHMSLLELADTNKPILRRLVMEAPGTYTHSMAVGQLAEAAAEAVGADSLFARVASYYHDIGKIRRPHFFVENQLVENVHDRMNPTLSALVIQSHIKDGMEVAKEFRLPPMLNDVIMQHHGTSLVQYFYSQATSDAESHSAVLEQQFRYGGPKPQTKEAGIVMLADGVEAASRCLSKPTPAKIEALVNKVISEKLSDGQLDDCELTFADISKIAGAFVRTLLGTLHARIEYPDVTIPDVKKISVNGDNDTKLSTQEDRPEEDDGGCQEASAS